jgi:hypothetical protein
LAAINLNNEIDSLPTEEKKPKERPRPRINQFCFLKEDHYDR